jgi:hypothetical protein
MEMELVRDRKDYNEIILTIGLYGTSLNVVVESALRLAVSEGAVVKFKFNGTWIVINPAKIRDIIIESYGVDRNQDNNLK